MQLTLRQSQGRTLFRRPFFMLWTRFDLTPEESHLISRYKMADAVLYKPDQSYNERANRRSIFYATLATAAVTAFLAWWHYWRFQILWYNLTFSSADKSTEELLKTIKAQNYEMIGTTFYWTIPLIIIATYILVRSIFYHSLREDVRVKDVVRGRKFKAWSLILLLEKENELKKVAVSFRYLLERMKNWNEDEVLTIELGAEPHLRVIGRPDAAA